MISRKTALGLLVTVASLILLLSLIPGVGKTPKVPFFDKAAHVVAYAVLGFLVFCAFPRRNTSSVLILLFSIGICAMYGGAIELLQNAVGRSSELLDLVSDLAGSALGASIGWLVTRSLPPK